MIAALFVTSCANEQTAFREIIQTQLQRYPAMQIEDLYKLVFQTAMGNEHLMADSAMVHDYLIKELEDIQASSAEPLLEEISPDGEVMRLNLRPFKARQGDHRALFQGMMQTSRAFKKSPQRLEQYLNYLEKMADSGAMAFDATAMKTFFDEMRNKEFPAVHHSTAYEEKYAPAYRVIFKKYIPQVK